MVQQVPSQNSSSPESLPPSQESGSSGLGGVGRRLFQQRSAVGETAKARHRRQRRRRDRSLLTQPTPLEGQKSSFRQESNNGATGRSSPSGTRPSISSTASRSSARHRMRVVGNDPVTTPPPNPPVKEGDSPSRKPAVNAFKRGRPRSGKRSTSAVVLLYILRLLILGIGIGVLAGTLLMSWDPTTQPSARSVNAAATQRVAKEKSKAQPVLTPEPLALGSAIDPLTNEIKKLAGQTPNLSPSVFLVDLDTSAYVDIEGATSIAAASTIKLPILVAFFQDLDAGKLRLDESLTMRSDLVAEGSGDMQSQPVGKQFSAWETALKMIVISDNTATNMLIERLGGANALNQRFKAWGLTATVINNPLPDLDGTNMTSARDLANLLIWINQGHLISLPSRDRLFGIMQRTETNTLLPRGLGQGAIIAHKTGDIGSVLADVGIIDLPNGKRYVAAVLVKRPHNDPQARTLIQDLSRAAYKHFNLPLRPNQSTASPRDAATAITSNAFTDADQSTPLGRNNFPRR